MSQSRLATIFIACLLSIFFLGTAAPTPPDPPIPPVLITGQILDPQGRVLPGARVELAPIARAGRLEAEPVGTAVSDASGVFSLKVPAAGMWTVRVKAPGYAGAVELTPLLEALELAPIELRPGAPPADPRRKGEVRAGRLTGRVLDRLTGKPVAGAFVWPREDPGAAVRTDPAGAYTLVDSPRGGVLMAAALQHLPAEATVRQGAADSETPEPGPEFVLSPAAAVAGSVVDAKGRPVAGVELAAQTLGAGLPAARLRARSDPQGRFTLGGLDPARAWELRAVRSGFLPATLPLADLKPLPSRSDLRIVLRPGRPALGTVVDEAGRPVAAAEVRVLPAEESGEPDFAGVVRVDSDAKGRFALDTLPASRVDLEVRARGFVPTLARGLAIAPGEGAFDLGSVILASGARVEGFVEDPQGHPVEGAAVTVQSADQIATRLALAGSPPEERGTVTGADGRFEVAGLRPGEAVGLLVRRPGYTSRTLSRLQPPLEEPVRVVLDPASHISGRVLDEKNDPIAGAQVVLRRESGIAGTAGTDGDGRFLLEGVPSGRFALDASAQGHLASRVNAIEVSAGTDLDDLDIVLPRGAALEGTVYAPDGSPAADAVVRALPIQGGSGPALLFVVPEARTDADGHYRLEGLREGRQSVVAEHPSYRRAAREFEIQEDEARLDLRLGEGWEVTGRAVDASGRGIVGVRVGLSAPDGGDRETLSGADGGFRFAGVGEGLHRLRAERQGYAPPPVREVQVVGGPVRDLELRLDRGSVLSGQILGLSFQDLARVQVAATQEGTTREQEGQTDYQGRYRVDDLAPGDWRVVARLPDGRLAQDTVTVPPGDRGAVLDLEFEHGLSLSGRVLAGAAPVAGALVNLRAGDGSGGGGRSDQQGEFRIEGLAPGVYTLLVIAPQSKLPHQETLDLRADRQIVIETQPPAAPSAMP
jgi:protocatechuate 3,4-dioxygenase beta subunit